MIHITSDHFVWLDVSEKATPLFPFFNLYEVGDDDADHLIEDISTIPSIISYGSRICIEVGQIPQEYLKLN